MRAVALLGVVALSSVLAVASATPAAATPTVTVDPSTALADGQPIDVTISGLEPGFKAATAQCAPPYAQVHDLSYCEPSSGPDVLADQSGTAVVHLRAKRVISTYNGIVDCASISEPCVIAGSGEAGLGTADASGTAPITFDLNAPPPAAPAVDATPRDGLVDGAQVTVHTTGFVPGEQVVVRQCAASPRAVGDCDRAPGFAPTTGVADSTGAATIDFTVHRVILVGTDHIDCAQAMGVCVIAAHAWGGPLGDTPIGFDGSTPVPPAPTLTIEPPTGLADHQIVRVHGSGFAPNGSINIVECRSDVTTVEFGCPASSVRSTTADSFGAFSTTTRVVRTLDHADSPIDRPRTTDCAEFPGRCVLWASDPKGGPIDVANTALAPLDFDPNATPVEHSITVVPHDDLVDGQTLHVTAGGFPPGTDLSITMCRNLPFPRFSFIGVPCDGSIAIHVTSDDAGHVDATYAARRYLFGSPQFDCAFEPQSCLVAVLWFGFEIDAAGVPVTFVAPPESTTSTTTASTTTTSPPVASPNVTLARTGAGTRDGLAPASVLLIMGGLSVIVAAELRHRARRRRTATTPPEWR